MRVVTRPPIADDIALADRLGLKGYLDDVPLAQFIRWSVETGLVQALIEAGPSSSESLATRTSLSPVGADVLLGVLVALDLAARERDGYAAAPACREFLDANSPYHLAESLLFSTLPLRLPARFVDQDHDSVRGARGRLVGLRTRLAGKAIRTIARSASSHGEGWDFGGERRLENQHQRNLPASVTAANLPLFAHARCVVDIGGGTGTLALALRELHRDTRIVIADLPDALDGIERFLSRFDTPAIEAVPIDVTSGDWSIPDCDVAYFGNLLHVFGDRVTKRIIEHTGEHLRRSGGGTIVVHEVVWNDDRTGPLKAALFDFTMRAFGGRQRTVAEFHRDMAAAGFTDLDSTPTTGGFVAISGRISA